MERLAFVNKPVVGSRKFTILFVDKLNSCGSVALDFDGPFREGNGRCSRLLETLMALQAGLPPLDFGGIGGEARRRYFAAIQAAMGRDYAPITAVFRAVIARTLRAVAG